MTGPFSTGGADILETRPEAAGQGARINWPLPRPGGGCIGRDIGTTSAGGNTRGTDERVEITITGRPVRQDWYLLLLWSTSPSWLRCGRL